MSKKRERSPASTEDTNQSDEGKQLSSSKHPKSDEATPKDEAALTIVGVGASAGGLEAFENFFTNTPPDSGMAFVLVQHLDPTHESILVDLIKRYTPMKVFQVEDKMKVKPNCIYVIPPNRELALRDNTLYLVKPIQAQGRRLAIDAFFRSLAEDQGERALCIILSGTGTDGNLGLTDI
jgi:two-component system CheB/CheR fusion protein